jgi:hypothetical protein
MVPDIWKKELINIHEEIINKHGAVDWVNETAKQLIKDFEMLQLSLQFKKLEKDDYASLFDQAIVHIAHLYQNNYGAFLNLLYRIDMDEAHLNAVVAGTKPPELYAKIAEMILKREFMKVVTRYRYK